MSFGFHPAEQKQQTVEEEEERRGGKKTDENMHWKKCAGTNNNP